MLRLGSHDASPTTQVFALCFACTLHCTITMFAEYIISVGERPHLECSNESTVNYRPGRASRGGSPEDSLLRCLSQSQNTGARQGLPSYLESRYVSA